ncbi:hypothetical protein ACSU1N_00515 [Thermogladius sp. 4427co]|uniref:hypothetical protein n=1 Tax=Thermogladius sp. 4427co TaxID=3450718 RepID=UPI003F796552
MEVLVIHGRDDNSLLIKSIVDYALQLVGRDYGLDITIREIEFGEVSGVVLKVDGLREIYIREPPGLKDLVEAILIAYSVSGLDIQAARTPVSATA